MHIALLHLMSIYVNRIGIPPSLWYALFFVSKGKVTCGAGTCKNCLAARLHQISAAVNALTAQSINAALAADPKLTYWGH